MGIVLLFPIRCRTCKRPVEEARRCYAIPTCYACLPPPKPLAKCYFRGGKVVFEED